MEKESDRADIGDVVVAVEDTIWRLAFNRSVGVGGGEDLRLLFKELVGESERSIGKITLLCWLMAVVEAIGCNGSWGCCVNRNNSSKEWLEVVRVR